MTNRSFGHAFVRPNKSGREVLVKRDVTHPITKKPGFDLMEIKTHSAQALADSIKEAEAKFWQVWTYGFSEKRSLGGAVLYKPCDIDKPWIDTPEQPHPGRPRAPQ